MGGIDVARIDGIEVTTELTVVSAVGADLSKVPERQAFCLVARAESGISYLEVFLERHHVAWPLGTIQCADRLAAQST